MKTGNGKIQVVPKINGCLDCYKFWEDYISKIRSWAKHVEKMDKEEKYKDTVRLGKQVAAELLDKNFQESSVQANQFRENRVGRSWVCLNLAELQEASGRKYLSKRALTGPQMETEKEDGSNEMEKVWLFKDPAHPYRRFFDASGQHVEKGTEVLSTNKHIYPSQACDAFAVRKQMAAECSDVLEKKAVYVPTLENWVDKWKNDTEPEPDEDMPASEGEGAGVPAKTIVLGDNGEELSAEEGSEVRGGGGTTVAWPLPETVVQANKGRRTTVSCTPKTVSPGPKVRRLSMKSSPGSDAACLEPGDSVSVTGGDEDQTPGVHSLFVWIDLTFDMCFFFDSSL